MSVSSKSWLRDPRIGGQARRSRLRERSRGDRNGEGLEVPQLRETVSSAFKALEGSDSGRPPCRSARSPGFERRGRGARRLGFERGCLGRPRLEGFYFERRTVAQLEGSSSRVLSSSSRARRALGFERTRHCRKARSRLLRDGHRAHEAREAARRISFETKCETPKRALREARYR